MARRNDIRDGGGTPKVRLYVQQPLASGLNIAIDGPPAHYLGHVMRLAAGDAAALFNGADGEWRARIEAIGRGRAHLRLDVLLREQQPEPGPCLLFAPIKKAALDVLVQKATELGASALDPVLTRFTTVERVNQERLRSQAIEAAEQCGRLTIPSVAAPRPLAEILNDWPDSAVLLMMDERGGAPIVDALAHLPRFCPDTHPPALLVGPEGGFSAEEAADLASRRFVVRVSMGPRILRAETAAIAALACWQAFAGDWRQRLAGSPTASPGATPDQPSEKFRHVGTE